MFIVFFRYKCDMQFIHCINTLEPNAWMTKVRMFQGFSMAIILLLAANNRTFIDDMFQG